MSIDTIARQELKSFIERIERLEEERKSIADDIKDVKGEAKGRGYDVTAINTIIRLRKKDANERLEQEAILDTYMIALGMLPEPTLFDDDFVPAPVDRDDRRRQRTSESMDDTVAMSAQMLADGLISEEGHRTTVIMANAVANKLGNGVITPSDAPHTSVSTVTIPSSDSEGEEPHGLPEISPDDQAPEDTAPHGDADNASAESVSPLTGSIAANAGGDHVAASDPAPEGAALVSISAPHKPLRPHCLRPGKPDCAGYGDKTCHACLVAARTSGEAA